MGSFTMDLVYKITLHLLTERRLRFSRNLMLNQLNLEGLKKIANSETSFTIQGTKLLEKKVTFSPTYLYELAKEVLSEEHLFIFPSLIL